MYIVINEKSSLFLKAPIYSQKIPAAISRKFLTQISSDIYKRSSENEGGKNCKYYFAKTVTKQSHFWHVLLVYMRLKGAQCPRWSDQSYQGGISGF